MADVVSGATGTDTGPENRKKRDMSQARKRTSDLQVPISSRSPKKKRTKRRDN